MRIINLRHWSGRRFNLRTIAAKTNAKIASTVATAVAVRPISKARKKHSAVRRAASVRTMRQTTNQKTKTNQAVGIRTTE